MNKLFNRLQAALVLTVMAVFSLLSCVNEDYDISEGIEMDMQLLQNTVIPLGSTGSIAINTLLGDTADGSFFNVADNGDMSLSFGHEVLSQTFSVPEVALDGKGGISTRSMNAQLSISDAYTSHPGNELAEMLAGQGIDRIYCSTTGEIDHEQNGIHENSPFNIDKELPESVLSIRTINMDDATMKFAFSTTKGAILNLEKGFVIEFPDCVSLGLRNEDVNYEIQDGHKVVFTEDTKLSYETPLVLDMKFNSLNDLEKMINEKKNDEGNVVRFITSEDLIEAYGKVYLLPADYGDAYIPKYPNIMMDIEMSGLTMTSAELIVNMDLEIEDEVIEVGDLPEMFTGQGTFVDFYNPVIGFSINNTSPLEMNLNAEITSKTQTHTTDLHIGNHCKNGNHETAPVVIPAETQVEYYFSRQGYHNTTGGQDIALEKLGDIISDMPEVLSIHDIAVESERKFITVTAGEEYTVNLEFDFSSDLSFGKNLSITFDYDIDLGLDTEALGLENVVLNMNMLNSIPLDLNVHGVVYDGYGNELTSSTMDLALNAGTLDNPVNSPAELSLSTKDSAKEISKLKLHITASSNEEIEGNILNMEQGLSINDLHLKLPEGLKLDLSNNDVQ